MDTRKTLDKSGSFLNMLTTCMVKGEPVALLYDDGGIARAGGIIVNISSAQFPAVLELDSGLKIAVSAIIAVNGIFLDSYSEC